MTTNGMPSLRKRELFAALGYQPHAGQVLVHRSKASRRVLACGVRWGKSTCAAMEAIAGLFEARDSALGWTVAPTYEASKRIFDEVVHVVHMHLRHRVVEYNPREHRLVVVNFGGGRSTLRGKSADNSVSLLSEAIDFVIVDEAARMKPEIWQQHLVQRLIDRNGWALLLSTPAGRNWFHKLFRRGQNSRDPSFESWAQPSWMNPHISRDLIEEERKRMDADPFGQEFAGKFIGEEREPCELCGYPNRATGCVVLVESGDDEPSACIDCGRPCDKEGNSVCQMGLDGQLMLTIVRLSPGNCGFDLPPTARAPFATDHGHPVNRIHFGPSPSPTPAFPDGVE